MDRLLEFCASSNGDRWLLGRNETLEGIVIHQPNVPSGGSASRIGIADFLVRNNADAPEQKALLRLIGSLVGDAPVSRGEGKPDNRVAHGNLTLDDDQSLEPISRVG